MKNKILALSLVLAFVFLGNTAYAAHYVLGFSSVDDGEIRWGGSTQYSSEWNSSISTWNALGEINIAPDTWWTFEDLTVDDVYESSGSWTGRWIYRSYWTDDIELNEYYLDYNTTNEKKNTITHELGHALGLAHSYYGNIMYYAQTSQTSLGSQDISDYNYLWD